ncbi:MAG: hypothetical protein ACOCX1_01355 [Fimbriimonadaceae bacterium]
MKRVFQDWRALCAIGLAAAGVAFLLGDLPAVYGVLLGELAGVVSFWGLWAVARVIGSSEEDPKAFGRKLYAFGALTIKLFVFGGTAIFALRLPNDGPTGFMAGLVLVYSCAVGWAVTREEPDS